MFNNRIKVGYYADILDINFRKCTFHEKNMFQEKIWDDDLSMCEITMDLYSPYGRQHYVYKMFCSDSVLSKWGIYNYKLREKIEELCKPGEKCFITFECDEDVTTCSWKFTDDAVMIDAKKVENIPEQLFALGTYQQFGEWD